MYKTFKGIVFNVIQPAGKGNIASKLFDAFIISLILISILSVFVMTFQLPPRGYAMLNRVEKTAVIIFTVEYLLRIWTADLLFPDSTPLRARLKYMVSGMAVIDLLAILPFYLPMILPVDLLGIRAVRLVRLLRLFKLSRYSEALVSIGNVFKRKSREMCVSVFFVFILLTIASLLIYYAEHDAQPDKFANAFSGLWWAVATLTTVGYGDIYPITVTGRILGTVIAIMGIGMVAIPTGILSAGFVEVLEKKNPGKSAAKAEEKEDKEEEKEKFTYCPHCGKKL